MSLERDWMRENKMKLNPDDVKMLLIKNKAVSQTTNYNIAYCLF